MIRINGSFGEGGEARYLERYFGEEYRRYSAHVSFVFPLIRPSIGLRKELSNELRK